MSEQQLQAIEARWAKATPGPWTSTDINDDTDWCGHWVVDLPDDPEATVYRLNFGDMESNSGRDIRNAEAIAAAPADIAALIAEVRRLQQATQ